MNDASSIATSGGDGDLICGLVEMLAHRGKTRCASSHVLALRGLLLRPGNANSGRGDHIEIVSAERGGDLLDDAQMIAHVALLVHGHRRAERNRRAVVYSAERGGGAGLGRR